MEKRRNIKRGEIYYADLRPVVGSEQGGIRPVLVVQNDKGNKCSPTTIVVTLTSNNNKTNIPTHVSITSDSNNGLKSDSTALCEQFRTIDKSRIKGKIGYVNEDTLNNVLQAVKISLAI
jgi:mRNA interferase MazF